MATPPRLPVGYYLANFETVLRTVKERYGDILSPAEVDFTNRFAALSVDSRRLYVRLISRRGLCFRRDRLRYREVADLDHAIGELSAVDLLDDGYDVPLEQRMALLVRAELRELAREHGIGVVSSARRDEVIEALVEIVDEPALTLLLKARFEIVRVRFEAEVRVFQLLFFGNLRQDWSEFVLSDLGVVVYEEYPLGRELRRFPDRQSLDDDLALRDAEQIVRTLLYAGDELTAAAWMAAIRDREWHPRARPRRDQALARIARQLERMDLHDLALTLYQATEVARDRRARLLHRAGRSDDAIAVAEAIVATSRDEAELDFARRFPDRVRGVKARRRATRPTFELTIAGPDGRPVELRTLAAVRAAGADGFFAENWLWRSLFGLAFWDIVFAPVLGAFHHPFQYGPTDLHTPEFRVSRADAIAARLERLRATGDDQLIAWFREVRAEKQGLANPFVAWDEELWPAIELAAGLVGGQRLAAVSDRVSRDPGRYAYGFPDLFVTVAEKPGFAAWEVKGPGDVLRPEQGGWIDTFNEIGIPARVLKVKWEAGAGG